MDQQVTTDQATPDSSVSADSLDLSELVSLMKDKASYELVSLPSGELRVVHQVTVGDLLVATTLLGLIAVLVAKWVWEATK